MSQAYPRHYRNRKLRRWAKQPGVLQFLSDIAAHALRYYTR